MYSGPLMSEQGLDANEKFAFSSKWPLLYESGLARKMICATLRSALDICASIVK